MINKKLFKLHLSALLILLYGFNALAKSPLAGLISKDIKCEEISFQTKLNSNYIRFEPTISSTITNDSDLPLQAYNVIVDETLLQGDKFYLHLIDRTCPESPTNLPTEINPSKCQFKFAVYRLNTDDQSIPLSTEYLTFDFLNSKIKKETANQTDSDQKSEITIPEKCNFLAKEYLEHSSLLQYQLNRTQ